MEWFSTLAKRYFASCAFLTYGNTDGPCVGICGWGESVVFPCVIEGSSHKVSEISVGKTSGHKFEG